MSTSIPWPFVIPQVLCLILENVSGREITRLFMAGNKALNTCMLERGGAISFEITFEQPHELCVPPVVYLLRHLRRLRLSSISELQRFAIRGLKPKMLPSSLTHFEVVFPNVNALMMPLSGEKHNLAHMFPILECLTSFKYPIPVRPNKLKLFPPLLLSLELHDSSMSLIPLIPRSVTKLQLDFEPIRNMTPIDMTNYFADPLFPPSLITLVVTNLPSVDLLNHLPSTLKSLHTTFRTATHSTTPLLFSQLPRGLTHLYWPFTSSRDLPITTEMIEALPRTLTSLALWGAVFPPENVINALPLGLNSLSGILIHVRSQLDWESVKFASQRVFVHLRSIQAHVTAFFEKIQWFPPGLTEIGGADTHSGLSFPTTLKNISFKLSARATIWDPDLAPPMDLPDSIEQLAHSFCINSSDLERLKSYSLLRSASLELEPHHLACLPSQLEELNWTVHSVDFETPNASVKHLTRLSKFQIFGLNCFASSHPFWCNLPTSIKTLMICVGGEGAPHGSLLQHLRSLPNLTNLEILPLIDLQDPHLINLPKKLIRLRLSGSSHENLTDACVAHLPLNLTSLALPRLYFTTTSPPNHDHLHFLLDTDSKKLLIPAKSTNL